MLMINEAQSDDLTKADSKRSKIIILMMYILARDTLDMKVEIIYILSDT